LALSSDNARLASAASQPEGTVRLWDLAGTRPKLRALLQVPKAPVESLAFSPTGNLLGVGCDKSVLLWNATKSAPREDRALIGHREAVKSMAFAPDGSILATGSLDGTVRLWSTHLAQPQELSLLEGSKAGIHAVAFSTDGKLLAWEGMDHTLQVGEMKRANQLITLRGHKGLIRMILFPADGTTLLTVDDKNWVFLWDLNSRSIVRRWLLPGGTTVASIGCTGDGRYLVAGTMGMVTVYRLYPKNKCASKEGQKMNGRK
jgi:WD40 repeat protein